MRRNTPPPVHIADGRAWQVANGGYIIEVSAEDADLLAAYVWTVTKGRYAFRRKGARGASKTIYLHREIACAEPGSVVDHINGNGLDNRRENLRGISQSLNNRNLSKRRSATSSRFKGVYWDTDVKRWRAILHVNKRRVYCGVHREEADAARAYNAAAIKHHGEFARLNPC